MNAVRSDFQLFYYRFRFREALQIKQIYIYIYIYVCVCVYMYIDIDIYFYNLKGNQNPLSNLLLYIINYSLLRKTSESLSKIRQRIRKLQLFEI